MLAPFARWLDRAAIRAACRTGDSNQSGSCRVDEAEQLLRSEMFTTPGPISAPALEFHDATRFTFLSAQPTGAGENDLVHGRLFRCAGKWQSHPTVLLLHGWNAEYQYLYQFPYLARRLRSRGLNTIAIELPYHGRRKPTAAGAINNFISSDLGSVVEATGQALLDARSTLAWLRDQGVPQVGVWGISLGGWLAGLLACSAEPLDGVVLMTPVVHMHRAVAELPFCAPLRQAFALRTPDFRVIDPARLPLRTPRERTLIVAARHDLFAPLDTLEELARTWGNPVFWCVREGHVSVLMALHVQERVVEWVADRLTSPREVSVTKSKPGEI